MAFEPKLRLTPRMLRQLKAIEQTTGFLKAVELRPDWIAEVRSRTNAQEKLPGLQIDGGWALLLLAVEGRIVAD